MRCSACGFENRPALRFCENCGTNLPVAAAPPAPPSRPAVTYCGNCSAQNRPGAQFCGTCGASLYGAAPAYQSPPRPAPPPVYSYRQGPSFLSAIASTLPTILILFVIGGIVYFVTQNIDTLSALLPDNSPIVIMLPTGPDAASAGESGSTSGGSSFADSTSSNGQPSSGSSSVSTGTPSFTASQDSLCRSGPSQSYEVKTSLNAGQSVSIVGKSGPEWEDWWQVNVSGVKCWVWSGLGSAGGDLSQIRVVEAPPVSNVRMRISNNMDPAGAGGAICSAQLYTPTQGSGHGYLVIDESNVLPPGESRSFDIPSGNYNVSICFPGPGGCCTGTYNGQTTLEYEVACYQNCSVNIP